MRFRFRSPPDLISVEDYRKLARRRLPASVYTFIAGGADDLRAVDANTDAFARWALVPRVLTGHADVDLSIRLLGDELSMPVVLAPAGLVGVAHWSGEVAVARAAEDAGTKAIISTGTTYSLEEISQGTHSPHYFQLYPWADAATGGRALIQHLMQRARSAGFGTLVVTVDVPVVGNREGERREGWELNPSVSARHLLQGARHPRWAANFLRHQRITARLLTEHGQRDDAVRAVQRQASLMRPDLSWTEFRWIRDQWSGPVYIKGVLHPADAARAVEFGADGVIVSNHGGRQLGEAPAALDVLADVVEEIGGRVPVVMDGGVRRGSDIVKALCLGASAVGIGRPWVYGLAAGGRLGVAHVLSILRGEMVRTMQLMGVARVADLERAMLVPANPAATTLRRGTSEH